MIKTINIFKIFFLLICIPLQQITALRCYSCSYTTTSGDILCTTDPISLGGNNIVPCSKKYCTIIRQEFKDPANKVASFVRGCEEQPQFLNDELEDASSKFYYRSCSTDLCNSGNGLSSSSASLSGDGGAGDNLLVKGVPGGSSTLIISTTLLLFSAVYFIIKSDLLK